MNYNSDRPIETEEQDLLGRSPFAKHLGKAIYDFNGKEGLVIGLFGKWGTGKTSVLNIAINEVQTLAERDENKPIIMKFSPWNYSDKDNLISLFFQSLKSKIAVQDNEDLKKKVGKALNDYAGAFDALSLVPIVGSGISAILKTAAQAQGTNLMQGATLDETRDKLEKALIEVDRKIIIVIDDIDRLTNSQIRDIFQLVKQVADFPNVIYLLAMDREVVRSALSEVHNIDGNEYLEKIIQVSFELPDLKKSKLHQIFFTKLDQLIQELPGEISWDESYWSTVFNNCIEPYLQTLRDINRVINTFQFRYGALYQETSFEDMVGITTIEVLKPELYNWISHNKEAVCGGYMHSLMSGVGNKYDYRKLYQEEFEKLGLDSQLAIKSISAMFPVFAKDVNEGQYAYQPASDIRSKMRAAHEGRFELYFMFSLEDIKVPRNVINACIFELDRDSLCSIICDINKQGYISYLLEEIRSLVDQIPYERLNLLASVMLDLQGEFQGECSRSIFSVSACDLAEYLATDMIKKLETESEKYEVIRSSLDNISKSGLGSMAQLLNRIELSYGRLAGDVEKPEEQLISLAHLQELETVYLSKIQEFVSPETIWDLNNFRFVSYLWECFDEKGFSDYMDSLLSTDLNKLKYICAMAGRWNGTNGSGWGFYGKDYSKYISNDEIYHLIEKLDKKNMVSFTNTEKIKLASFFLNYGKEDIEHVNEKEAQKLVDKWANM